MRSMDLKMSLMTETPSGVDIYFMELQRLARLCVDKPMVPHELVDARTRCPMSDAEG